MSKEPPDPPCTRGRRPCTPYVGRMSWPPDLNPGPDEPMASAYVCVRGDHQRETAAWVYVLTGHLGEFRPLPQHTRAGAA